MTVSARAISLTTVERPYRGSPAVAWPPLHEAWPTLVLLLSSIVLQRFKLPLAGFSLPISVVCAAGVFAVLLFQNRVVASRRSLSCYVLFCLAALGSTVFAIVAPPQGTSTSFSSLLYLLLLYSFAGFRWRPALGVMPTLALFRALMGFIAVCACLQFVAQLLGISFFSFSKIVPESLLLENDYNVVIPLWQGGGIYKSNGVFLLEPSILSQFVALALVVEFLYFGSTLRTALLALALLFSFSGTGMLLLAFAGAVACVFSRHALWRLIALALLVAGVIGAVMALAPDYADVIVRRSSELSSEQSSGSIRFISPYCMLADVFTVPRALLGFGPGTVDQFRLDYTYGSNALTKLLVEYGVLGLISGASLLTTVVYRRETRTLSLVGLCWFVFGGGYLLTPAVVLCLSVLFAWGPGSARLRPESVPQNAGVL